MENIMIRVHQVLRKDFSPKEILLQSAGGGMVGGWIISKSFARLTEIERQQKIWKLFDRYLDEKERRRIVGFLTFTPLEKKIAFDDDLDELPVKKKAITTQFSKSTGNGHRNGRATSKRRLSGA